MAIIHWFVQLFSNVLKDKYNMSNLHILEFLAHLYKSRVENEKGLCAYILYMHIAPFHFQPSKCT